MKKSELRKLIKEVIKNYHPINEQGKDGLEQMFSAMANMPMGQMKQKPSTTNRPGGRGKVMATMSKARKAMNNRQLQEKAMGAIKGLGMDMTTLHSVMPSEAKGEFPLRPGEQPEAKIWFLLFVFFMYFWIRENNDWLNIY
tara:strand:+ start:729 stop:1151 length:423 start_codon:yes stop_codon:yes gene_type:complete